MKATTKEFMSKAIKESEHSLSHNHGGPFGAVIVKDNKVISQAHNSVLKKKDPTAHAEMEAIRKACKNLKSHSLEGCEIYTSCEPCPMCLGAIMWARIDKVFYATSQEDAKSIDFDDSYFYEQIAKDKKDRDIKFKQVSKKEERKIMKAWAKKDNKKSY